MLSSDLTSALIVDMGETLWKNKSTWDKTILPNIRRNWTQPILFIHSDLTYRCPILEGLTAFSVCQPKGIESRFLNIPNETHITKKPENSLRWLKTVLGWINKYAGVEGVVVLEPPVAGLHRG